MDSSDTLDKIATAETPEFLGLFRGVIYEYETFDRFVLQRDLARIERYYRARGYYEARARAGRVIQKNDNHVRVEIVVEEGDPVLVDDLEVAWPKDANVPDDVKLHAFLAAKKLVRVQRPFDEDKYTDAETEVKRVLTDAGYAFAKISRNADVNITTHKAVVTYSVAPDQPATFGTVTIDGLDPDKEGPLKPEIPEDIIRRTIVIKPGDKYSTADIDSASGALTDLEVFSSVRIVPQLSDPPPANHVVPIVVTVQPAKLRALRIGGGVELDNLKTDVHGVIGWEDHNFLGNLRDVSINFKPGVVLYPTRLTHLVAPTRPLPEEKLQVTFKQPSFLEARTEGFIKPEFNIYPIIVPQTTAQASSQGTTSYTCTAVNGTTCGSELSATQQPTVIGYLEPKIQVGLDRLFFRHLFIKLSQNEQYESPFAYVGTLDSRLTPILLSYPELQTILDLTDNKLHPHAGIYIGNDLQVAGGPFFGTAQDVKVQPEIRGYIPLGKRLTIAMRATTGFLFPQNWGEYIRHDLNDFTQPGFSNIDGDVRDLEIDLFRGFLSGGPSSNRGYPSRTIGAWTFVPFFNAASVASQVRAGEDCVNAVSAGKGSNSTCRTPVGGMSLWEASTELRILITGPLSMATFCDGSDVSTEVANIRINHPHISCGAGGRYDTPVGPLRLDIGYRVPGLQYPSGDPLEPDDQQIGTIFTAPIAVSAGIGEAF